MVGRRDGPFKPPGGLLRAFLVRVDAGHLRTVSYSTVLASTSAHSSALPPRRSPPMNACLLYTSDAADDKARVDL
ncbi:hypothetical protein FA562_26480, partial [Pseudomonas aeruginosa]|nr:hypothetical protein [Pseudomonas aeruginosa]